MKATLILLSHLKDKHIESMCQYSPETKKLFATSDINVNQESHSFIRMKIILPKVEFIGLKENFH